MKRKVLSILLSLTLMGALLAGCGEAAAPASSAAPAAESGEASAAPAASSDIKVGVIYIGDENEGYTYSHMKGIDDMQANLGLSDAQIIEKTNIPEGEECYDAAVDLAEQGCNIIFANSFGHEDYMIQAAGEYPDIQFLHATGFQAASSGLPNFHNYFTKIYEARYVSGIVAGMKLKEMIDKGEVTADKAKIGYVGAYPYAEVVSGFTSFFLGARSIVESATMEVQYTNSWADMSMESEVATKLIQDGCVLISQHADTTGAPTACESAKVPCVGYNVDMISVAPTCALTSPTNKWGAFYTIAVDSFMNGKEIPVDWAGGYAEDAVEITALNSDAIAEGTEEKVKEVEDALKAGTLHVFDVSTFTVDGKPIEDDLVSDGYYHESEKVSAPSFSFIIDGITTQE
ncbi:MAG: BMP family ABC transporter substrate-binding protein [Lachnospiraceae bacterium]|nr:BMP family ABC transporter substrate-binding protein [Lachnospiraceae bacterium]